MPKETKRELQMVRMIREFIQLETSSGIILVAVAVIALIISNTPLDKYYEGILSLPLTIGLGPLTLSKPLLLWINDGLMAIFFLLVGLEIKRECVIGELNSVAKAILPGIAAVGGMILPALIYIALNHQDLAAMKGWAIPTATDIAFSLGILSLLGPRVPSSLKIFLTALAILDDLGAIIIIAIYYTVDLSMISLELALACLALLTWLNYRGVCRRAPYVIIGIILWICVLKSGVHATLAGVALAFAIPLKDKNNPDVSPLREMEHALHPWVAFGVLPIFAFANAGVSFTGITFATLMHAIPLGIALGLFLGKQVGILSCCWLAVKTKIAKLPSGANWSTMYGIALLCGVGFTMSLFVGTLAFGDSNIELGRYVRLGVLSGSLLSGLLGYFVLRCCGKQIPAKSIPTAKPSA